MTWEEIDGKLTKEFEFEDFVETLEFVVDVGELAEEMGHHPDLLIHSYNKLKIMVSTHDSNSITEKDHELAAEIDEL